MTEAARSSKEIVCCQQILTAGPSGSARLFEPGEAPLLLVEGIGLTSRAISSTVSAAVEARMLRDGT
jgi:hypothetical protein